MDLNEEGKSRPVSIEALKQLEEQSDVCNFTVKHGNWSKRYHDRVLCASPFVKAMMRNNFNEKTKGYLELKQGSPESIDMVMMFLYGQFPKLTMDNVFAVMTLAEFLLITNLMAFCIDWINNETKLDKENVEKLLHLSSIFDFEVPTLTKYIRQHLPELFGGNQLLTITADTLEKMLSDETLTYVNADVRFEFIMRWVKHSPEQRKPKLDKIIAGIELSEVAAGLIEKAKGDKHLKDLQTLYETETQTVTKLQNVLITPKDLGHFWVFDLAKERWFRLKGTPIYFDRALTFTYAESILCLVEKSSDKCVIRLHDCLELAELPNISVNRITSHDRRVRNLNNIYISDKVCYAVSNYKVSKVSNYKVIIPSCWTGRLRRHIATIFLGAICERSNETILTPLLSVNVNFEVQLVVNDSKLIALFSTGHNFFCIYDQRSCKIKNIDLNIEPNDEVNPFKDGFVIYDRKKIRFIQSQTGLRNERIFSVYESCPDDKIHLFILVVVRNKWVRFRKLKKGSESFDAFEPLEYTADELGKVNVNDAKWKPIPLPEDNVGNSIIRNIQEMDIPRSKLKCNIKCPHCERIREEELIKTEKTHKYIQKGVISNLNDDDFDYDNDENEKSNNYV